MGLDKLEIEKHLVENEILKNQVKGHCRNISINKLGDATWTNQCEYNNLFGSAGRATGGTLTHIFGNDYVTVAAGTGYIKKVDEDDATLYAFDWEADTVTITNDTTFIGVEYHDGGSRIIQKTSFYDFDLDTQFMLGTVYREEVNSAYIYCAMNTPWWVTDGMTNLLERFYAEGKVFRDKSVGGMLMSNPATTKLAVTTGKIWALLSEFTMTAIDTSVPTGSFYYLWYSSTNGWQLDLTATDYSVLQWNDITAATLQNLNNNKFANIWVYACPGVDKFSLIYPQAYYNTSASAEAEAPPTMLPGILLEEGLLVGRLIIKKGTDTPISIQSAFDQTFIASQAADHGNLAGLNDDDHTQYILHSLADAENDFLIASAADNYVKKTLAETGAILETDLDHGNIQGLSADDHTQYARTDGTRAITGDQTFNEDIIVTKQASVQGIDLLSYIYFNA